MTKTKILISLLIISSIISCKTTEQIQREKLVENVSGKVVQLQKDNADLSIAIQDLQDRMSHMQGKKGEQEYKEKKRYEETITKLKADIEVLQTSFNNIKKQQELTNKELKEQKDYLKQVLSTLGKISGKNPKKTSKKKNPLPGGHVFI